MVLLKNIISGFGCCAMQAADSIIRNANASEIYCLPNWIFLLSSSKSCSVAQSNNLYYSFLCLQNDLEEFFAMVNFTNPGILGDASYFRRYYQVNDISIPSIQVETDCFAIGLSFVDFHTL